MEQEKTYSGNSHNVKNENSFQKRNNNNYKNQNNKDENIIKCFRCERTGHYASECRINAHKLPGFCNPYNNNNCEKNTNIKKKYSSNNFKLCQYCKKKIIIFKNVENAFLMKIKRKSKVKARVKTVIDLLKILKVITMYA